MKFKHVNTMGFNVFSDDLNRIELRENKIIINTINPHSYCTAKKDSLFYEALIASDIILPDGIGIVWAENKINGNTIRKIAGFDIFIYLMNKLDNENGSVFFLGASIETLKRIQMKCNDEFPNVKVAAYSPPYKTKFSKEDSDVMCEKVNSFSPDVLFVGMTAPKQEKWVHEFKDDINAKAICSIGAVFDFYAGNLKRSSPFWIDLGLEWLPRLIKEPKRLFYRNFVSSPKFILEVFYLKYFKTNFLKQKK